ncbi:hypothetical protein GIB67_040111, partial [Kingdonia uniflora]
YDSARAADPEEAEVISVIRGMEAAHRLGLDWVLLLTDCQRLVRAFRDCSDDLSWGALTLAHNMCALAAQFQDFQFAYVERSKKFVAHFVAAKSFAMALAGRLRSTFPLINNIVRSESLLSATISNTQFSRNYASTPEAKEVKVKVPLPMFGISGNYASALYLSAVKTNVLDKVETELLDIVEASKRSPRFSLFIKDISIPRKTKVKQIAEICSEAKLTTVIRNFMVILTENERLRHMDAIANKFLELTNAQKGVVIATVTTVIIDTSILGGLVVEFSQKVFDVSIKTRARQMERFLRDPINFDSIK